MIKYTLLILLCIFPFSGINANPADSTIYSNAFEKSLFQKLQHADQIDSAELFIALNYTNTDIQKTIKDFSRKLQEKVSGFPDNKKLKTIYNEVHDKFLVKYAQEAYFNDIFSNGNYNCVSASALYAIIFNELGIRYMIKQKPDHVYLIADPAKTSYMVETTLPGEKMLQFDDRFKAHYVEYLHNNKIVSDREFDSESVDQLFEKYYTSDKTISLKELAGLHYYNKGVFDYNKSLFGKSYEDLEKAYLLNHDKMISFMRNNALLSVLNAENQKKTFKGYTLAKYIASNDSNNMGIQYGRDFFNTVASELVINHPNIIAFKKYFADFQANVEDEDISEFVQQYYFFLGYSAAVNYRYPEALSNLKKAYNKNPDNVNTRQLVAECVSKYLMNDRNHSMAIDSLTAYFNDFPFLKSDKNMMNYLEYCFVKTIESLFMYDEAEGASVRMKDYERFLKMNPDFEPNQEFIKIIYQQQTFYYLRKNKTELAEQALRKGIRIIPQSEDLKNMLRSIMETKGVNYEYPELMSDTKPLKKYLLAVALAKDNLDDTNENTGKYLMGNWKVSSMIEEGVEKELPGDLKMSYNLMDNRKAEYTTDSKKATGVWNYNPSKGILDVTIDQKEMHLIITHLGSSKMRGVLYQKTDYENSHEIILIKGE